MGFVLDLTAQIVHFNSMTAVSRIPLTAARGAVLTLDGLDKLGKMLAFPVPFWLFLYCFAIML